MSASLDLFRFEVESLGDPSFESGDAFQNDIRGFSLMILELLTE